MGKAVLSVVLVALLGIPASAGADRHDRRDQAHRVNRAPSNDDRGNDRDPGDRPVRGTNPGDGAAHAAAQQQCANERRTLGVAAFRAKYGTPHAFARCVQAHLDRDRAAAASCVAERNAIGVRAFRQKYGKPHALRNCVIQHTGTS